MAEPRLSARALASLTAQDDYLRALNPAAADAVLSEIERLVVLIGDFPMMGRRIEGTGLRYHVTRRYRYRVVYRVAGEAVEIVEILHPRQG